MRITLDTNVLVSGTFWTGSSYMILNLIDKKRLRSISSKEIIEEYYEVINSDEIIDKVEKKKLIMYKLIEKVIKNSEITEPKTKLSIVKEDPDDDKILECAKEGGADYIITQDEHLLKLKKFDNILILKPDDFLKLL